MFKNLADLTIKLKPALLSICSGIMLVLIFPRFNLDWMAWFALIPLFFALHEQPLNRVVLYGFVSGFVFYFFGLNWVTNTMVNYGNIPVITSYLILALLTAYLSFFFSLFCYLTQKLSRGNSIYFSLLAPLIWTGLEFLRSTPEKLGFSWLGLGYSQFQTLPVIQLAEYTGVYGISTLIVFVNSALFVLLKTWLTEKGDRQKFIGALRVSGVAFLVLFLWIGYGLRALSQYEQKRGPETLKIGLAQGNIEQQQKWNPIFRDQVMNIYGRLTLKAAESDPDLIVWPEAATPFFFNLNKEYSSSLRKLVTSIDTPLLFGTPYSQTNILYNRAYLINAGGQNQGHYDKIHLVPFGEFVPFKELLFFVEKMVEIIGDFGRGNQATVFELDKAKFGVSICYEITFPDLTRQSVKNGAGFLVNITNDAWFGYSAASYQHMSMGALRAVENRVPIVRSANTGITGTIDANGSIRQTTDLFVRDLVITDISPRNRPLTYYSKYGDVHSYLSIILAVVVAVLARKTTSGIS